MISLGEFEMMLLIDGFKTIEMSREDPLNQLGLYKYIKGKFRISIIKYENYTKVLMGQLIPIQGNMVKTETFNAVTDFTDIAEYFNRMQKSK